jgi:hypothetical protein
MGFAYCFFIYAIYWWWWSLICCLWCRVASRCDQPAGKTPNTWDMAPQRRREEEIHLTNVNASKNYRGHPLSAKEEMIRSRGESYISSRMRRRRWRWTPWWRAGGAHSFQFIINSLIISPSSVIKRKSTREICEEITCVFPSSWFIKRERRIFDKLAHRNLIDI